MRGDWSGLDAIGSQYAQAYEKDGKQLRRCVWLNADWMMTLTLYVMPHYVPSSHRRHRKPLVYDDREVATLIHVIESHPSHTHLNPGEFAIDVPVVPDSRLFPLLALLEILCVRAK